MAVLTTCFNCGEKISIREMPNGYWIPFDKNTVIRHECYEKRKRYSKMEVIKFAINNNLQISHEVFDEKEGMKRTLIFTPVDIQGENQLHGFYEDTDKIRKAKLENFRNIKIISDNKSLNNEVNNEYELLNCYKAIIGHISIQLLDSESLGDLELKLKREIREFIKNNFYSLFFNVNEFNTFKIKNIHNKYTFSITNIVSEAEYSRIRNKYIVDGNNRKPKEESAYNSEMSDSKGYIVLVLVFFIIVIGIKYISGH